MNFEKVTYEAEKKLLDEISSEKKFLTFKKLFKRAAADMLKITRATLYSKLKKYNIQF